MKSLKQHMIDESLKGIINKVKNRISKDSKNTNVGFNNSTNTAKMDDVVKHAEENLKDAHNGKNLDNLIKDMLEIIEKDKSSFNAIKRDLLKWTAETKRTKTYELNRFVGSNLCTEYLKTLCSKLSNVYGWEGIAWEDELEYYEDEEGNYAELPDVYDTTFIAFTLASIANEI